MRSLLLLAASVALTGCTVLTSESPQSIIDDGRKAEGVFYSLPKTIVDLTLFVVEDRAEYKLVMGPPRSIADAEHQYVLRYRPLPNYSDQVEVAVTSQSLLKSIASKTKDETKGIIVNLVKAFAGLGGSLEAAATEDVQLASVTFDPTDEMEVADALRELNQALLVHAKNSDDNCKDEAKKGGAAVFDQRRIGACREYADLKSAAGTCRMDGKKEKCLVKENGPVQFLLRRVRSKDIPASRWRVQDGREGSSPYRADCTVGVCYRPPLLYWVHYSVGAPFHADKVTKLPPKGVYSLLALPNEAAPVEIDIRRAFFVEKTQKINFDDNGFLESMEIKKPSEIEAISTLPVEIITAVTATLRVRLSVVDQQINEAGAIKSLTEARYALQQQQAMYESAETLATSGHLASTAPAVPLPLQSAVKPVATAAPDLGVDLEP